uniref:Ovule protein n=1 Tax=Haemonchus contortus TaxID=6289 RepID=A0A7I4YYR7_HAECO
MDETRRLPFHSTRRNHPVYVHSTMLYCLQLSFLLVFSISVSVYNVLFCSSLQHIIRLFIIYSLHIFMLSLFLTSVSTFCFFLFFML